MDNAPAKVPTAAWLSIGLSIAMSAITFAYTTGVQAQRITALETTVEQQQTQVIQTPAIVNELSNINRRLQELKTAVDNLPKRQ